ncbi:hypothetical protein H8B13_17575 [Hymenobacter sp. BT188]|uniref:hypothetical protein n=1 Tax=Hymenobacter sp. BT188 TaxID=2763504 RepID=UPI0016513B89|nr:hypothetical protein [Hymenobacter sp. BT188]MBC6608641.1 hypothetical protein [Hymenobacter sp. BT188]
MKIFPRFAALLIGVILSASSVNAQTELGKPTLDESKTQIWCATAKFVYEDTGVPELKGTLRCDGSLQAFENSIKADKQSVYSRLYKPLERGAIYNGLTTDEARLNKLTTEIINRLKNPARTNDPVRMQRLTALETGLKGFVQNGTPLGDTSADLVAEEAADTASLADTTVDSDVGVALPTGTSVSSPRTYAAESTISKLFAPIALVFSILSLVLFALQRGHIKALNARAERHRAALEAVKLAMPSDSPSLKKLTPELQREIEKIVEQRVGAVLAQAKPAAQNLPPRPAVPAPPAPNRPSVAVTPSAPTVPPAPVRPAAPVAATPSPQPAPQQTAPTPPAPVPTYTAPAPIAEAPVAVPTPVIPVGPPAAASRDDFDSLVPPVQLPTPDNWSVAPPINKPENQPVQTSRYYVKVPVNGGFSEYDLQEQPQHDSIYEIKLDVQRPERATFRITSNTAVHAYAIQSAQYSLREACRYQQPSTPVSRIVTDEEGTLFKSNGAWQIEQKAAIHFE